MAHRPTTIHGRTALFREASAIVEREYATDMSLDDVARRIATSRRQLQRAYLEIGRTTFREQIAEIRMRRAAELLATDERLSVRRVAWSVGYQQPAQFAKAFRRYQGVAPSAYRIDGDGNGNGHGVYDAQRRFAPSQGVASSIGHAA